MAMDIGAATAGWFDMVHAELVAPRAKTPHSVIWDQNYGIVVNENCERFHDEDYLFATTESSAASHCSFG
jgi:tricarballylate dehydrogenase